jgi:DNA uptake protein ComE-like DNA-binding protein
VRRSPREGAAHFLAGGKNVSDKKMKTTARVQRLVIEAALFAFAIGFAAPSGAAETGSTSKLPEGHPPMGKPSTAPQKAASDKPVKLVDINSASRAELKTLPGIGDAEADRIIKGRPYLSKAELVTRNVMPEGVYVSLKKQIIAKQPSNKPATKK